MNNLETSQGAMKRGSSWYQGAIRAFEDERWDDVIYSFQMSVEQALKAILILFGIEYPKKHDVSKIYLSLKKHSIPKWFLEKIDFHAHILEDLIKIRGIAAYGYVKGITKDHFKDDASKYKEPVKEIIDDCNKLIIEFSKKHKEGENQEISKKT